MKDVFKLIPEGSSKDRSNEYKINLLPNTILVKRRYSTLHSELQDLKVSRVDYSLSNRAKFYGTEIVAIGNISEHFSEFMIPGKVALLRQHAEFTMIPTLFPDDIFRCVEAAKEKKIEVGALKQFAFSIYAVIDCSSVLSVVDVDLELEDLHSLFLL